MQMDMQRSWARNKGVVQSDPAKQLLLLSLLHKNGRLSRSQLTTLKDLVVERNDSVGYVVQVFELMDDDFDELEDNLKHLCKYEEERRAEEITLARSSMAAAHSQGGGVFSFASSPPAGQFALSPEAGGLGITDPGWSRHLSPEFAKPYFRSLQQSVAAERQAHTVYPPEESVYSAFNYTPLDQVKVVILGQDPYFNENQAHGLSFSVTRGVAVPPSLKKIYAELERSIPGWRRPNHGCLTEWAQRGVLLLNATLTVRAGIANSHAKFGWQTFTDEVIKVLNRECEGVVYLLWGEYAQKKGRLVDESRHRVLRGPHPSPLARGFEGCNHFVQCNELLRQLGKTPVDWSLSP